MMKTNLTPSPRLIGQWCCCFKDSLYNKTTLLLLIFMLPLAGFAQQTPQISKAKEAQHQEYLQGIQGNKAEPAQALSNNQAQSMTLDKEQILEEEAYRNALLKHDLVEQDLFDKGLSKEDILAEIDAIEAQILETNAAMSQTNLFARSGGGDYCTDAVVLLCDTPIVGDNFAAYSSGAPQCGGNFGDNGVWFVINGNNDMNTVALTASSFASQINVYSVGDENDPCNTLQCAGGASGQGGNSVTFFAAGDLPYYIQVSGQFGFDAGTFTINRTSNSACNDTPPGDGLTPETGFELVCNDVQTINTTGFPSSSIGGFCGTSSNSTPAVWYKFTAVPGTQETIAIRTCGGDSKLQVFSTPTGGCIDGNDDDSWTGCSSFGESEVNFTAQLNETYYIKLFSYSGSGATYDIEVLCSGNVVTPPPSAPNNDLCPDATQLLCNTTVDGTNIAATNADQPGFFCGTSINNVGVWYYYDGEGDEVIVNTCGFDTKMNVYTGSCGALTCVGGNDDTGVSGCTTFGESQVTFTANSGQRYYIYVSSYSSSFTGDFEITLTCPEPIANDTCEDAILAECGDEIEGTMLGATETAQPFCFSSSYGPGVWYRHIGTGELLTLDTNGSAMSDTKLYVFTGDCEALTCVAYDDDDGDGFLSLINLTTVAGEEYFIHVTAYSDFTTLGAYRLNLTCQPDPCEEAEDIACGETATGTTLGGSTAGPTDFCGTTPGATGVYYRYVGTDEFVTASLCNSSYDTKINVLQGSCGALTCVGGNDDSCGSRSEFTWFAGAGEEYYIWVSGFGSATGNYELTMTCNQPVANDLCEDAPRLSCDVIVSGSTTFATDRDRPDSDCSEFSQTIGEGVWYTLAGTGGDIRLSLCDSDFDTKILVFTGECGDDLECYAGNDDNSVCNSVQGLFRSELTMPTEAGVIYTIYVTGYTYSGGPQVGNFNLEVDCLCAPSQLVDNCITIYDGYDDPNYSTGTLTGILDYANEPVTYLWSNGDTTQTTTVYAADGSGNYSVTMTDADGCTGTQEFFVYAMDINCDTRGTDKVEVCHNGTTICVAPSAVEAHLQHGDVLGTCGNALCDGITPLCDLTITSPASGANDVSNFPVIEWTEASGLVDGYTVSIVDENGVEVVNADAGDALSYVVGTDLGYLSDYTVSVSAYNANGNALGCPVNSFTTIAEPSGDGFTPQTALSVSCGVQGSGETPNPNSDDSAASFCGTSSGIANGSWFTFVGTGGTINVNTVGSFADTKLQVYSSNDGGNSLNCVGGDDDISFPSILQSEVQFSSTLGQQYFAYVSSYNSTSYPSGPFVLTVDCNVGARPGDIKGGSQNSSVDWALAPNPTRGNVTLNLGKYIEESVNIEVIDFTGKVISSISIDNLRTPTYDLELSSSLPTGLYFVRVSSDLRNSTKKLMIMR